MAEIKKLAYDLIALCQLDIDAVIAYEHALPNIDHPVVRKRFAEFMNDHNRHIVDLSQQIRDLGEIPSRRELGRKGFITAGFTEVHAGEGIKTVIEEMDANERIVDRVYGEVMNHPDLVPEARDLVRENYQDEKKHLEFIEECVEARVWERADAVK